MQNPSQQWRPCRIHLHFTEHSFTILSLRYFLFLSHPLTWYTFVFFILQWKVCVLQKHGSAFRSSRRDAISFIVKASQEPSPSSTGLISQGLIFLSFCLSIQLELIDSYCYIVCICFVSWILKIEDVFDVRFVSMYMRQCCTLTNVITFNCVIFSNYYRCWRVFVCVSVSSLSVLVFHRVEGGIFSNYY